MPEAFKEFTNQNYTSSNITNNDEIVLFTNNSTTKAIVRDVTVQNNDFKSTEAKFYVEDIIVGDSFQNSDGTVFVDENQSFSVKLNTAPPLPQTETANAVHVSLPSSSDIMLAPVTESQLKSGAPYPVTGIPTGNTVGTAVDINPPINWISPTGGDQYMIHDVGNNNDYWIYQRDTNSQSNMSWWDGTTRQQVDTSSYRGGYIDGEAKKAYVNAAGTIKVWDMTQQSTNPTTFSSFYSTNSTYSVGSACNGVYFYTYNGVSNSLFFRDTINHPSGTSGNLVAPSGGSGGWGAHGSAPVVVVAFNSVEDKYYVLSSNGTSGISSSSYNAVVTKQEILDSNSTSSATPSVNLGNNLRDVLGLASDPFNGSGYYWSWNLRHMGGPYISFPLSSTTVGVWKCENDALTRIDTLTVIGDNGSPGQRNSYVQANGSLTDTNYSIANYTINNQIRTVGIEIT